MDDSQFDITKLRKKRKKKKRKKPLERTIAEYGPPVTDCLSPQFSFSFFFSFIGVGTMVDDNQAG
jgi:hypothetical protein